MIKESISHDELHYRRLREVQDKLVERILTHGKRLLGEEALDEAFHEFLLWPDPQDTEIEGESFKRHMSLFWPWFVFNWEYEDFDGEVEPEGLVELTMAELYAQERGPKLEALERTFIEALNRKPYTFYEVVAVEPGKGIFLQDVFTGSKITVQERSGSQHVRPADIVFGRAVIVDGIGMIVGLSSYAIPPGHKPMLIDLREEIKSEESNITDEVLYDWDMEIRELYLDIDEVLFTAPKVCNTDGDPLQFHKVVYAIDSAEKAFVKLASLCVTETADELRKTAEVDADGCIQRIEFSWTRKGHKGSPGMSNTILGSIVIHDHRLKAEVNSAQRAEIIRREIEDRLGSSANFRIDQIQSLDAMLDDEELKKSAVKHSAEHNALMQNPEVRQQMADLIRNHWQGWMDMELPVLGGKTPRAAAKTAAGREAVEALLKQAERSGSEDPELSAMNREGAQLVREQLGLAKSFPLAE